MTRCRSVCANDHSPSTDTSTVPAGIAASALERGRPGALECRPGGAQAVRIAGAPIGAAGEAAVELGLDERGHVDAVDQEAAAALEEPRCVDVRALHVDAAHHDAGQVSPRRTGRRAGLRRRTALPSGRRNPFRWSRRGDRDAACGCHGLSSRQRADATAQTVTTRSRPVFLAWYIARSASAITSSTGSPALAKATPMLTVTCTTASTTSISSRHA